ncbi:hypothetical protein OUZ56_018480 [Daphnia magna]|uniref:Uncharacterized protein n=1 Tax=Daphnia magna TaxID=35525 RepID=A0ABQ9Z935_9CRUS|nr:hypothetical protein OUZ56_018480 [Daphnia magna]
MATSPSTRAAYHISTHLPRTRFFSHAITINVIKFGLATGTPTTIRYVKGETKATETENPKATTNSTLGLHFINFPGKPPHPPPKRLQLPVMGYLEVPPACKARMGNWTGQDKATAIQRVKRAALGYLRWLPTIATVSTRVPNNLEFRPKIT